MSTIIAVETVMITLLFSQQSKRILFVKIDVFTQPLRTTDFDAKDSLKFLLYTLLGFKL